MSLEVVCAVIVNNVGKLLACKRGSEKHLAGKWEFPGGKVEQHETPEDALKREISEELEVDISILDRMETVSHNYEDIEIALTPFLCEIIDSSDPIPLEHADIRWVHTSEAPYLDWAAADISILDQYKNLK